jgi:3-keto-disaccharide hydrolase
MIVLPRRAFLCIAIMVLSGGFMAFSAETAAHDGWTPLFNGTNLNGWYVVLRNSKSDDTNHLVQVENGMIHMYKDAPAASAQPAGYIVTDKQYSNYHLRLEYKWGEKRFQPRLKTRRDAGILYHVGGKDGVWPRSVECQIQENDVGDIFTVNTRLTATVDPATTNLTNVVTTNEAGLTHTNLAVKPVFLEPDKGGISFVQGVGDGIRRVIRNPMNEHEGWNTVEVIVHGDEALYIVNGNMNNRASKIQQKINGEWVPLRKGKIALQLEFAEVYYRNVEIQQLGNVE